VTGAVRALAVAIGTGFGSGFSPIAPGTAGSVLGVLLFLPLASAGPGATALVVALLFPVGVWAATICGERYGAHDHGRIVIDEIVGQLIALATFPAHPLWLVCGFLLFRFFDITKPFPARRIDLTWRSGTGVMADDVVAGIYANLALQCVRLALAS
jgi:phosphatidylglycerophosphatase A